MQGKKKKKLNKPMLAVQQKKERREVASEKTIKEVNGAPGVTTHCRVSLSPSFSEKCILTGSTLPSLWMTQVSYKMHS